MWGGKGEAACGVGSEPVAASTETWNLAGALGSGGPGALAQKAE